MRRLKLLALACLVLVGCSSRGWVWSGEETATSNLVLSDTAIFFASTRFGVKHYLNAIVLNSGQSFWKVRLRGWDPYTHVVSRRGVVVAAGPEFVRAFDIPSGRDRWKVTLDAQRVDTLDLEGETISLVVAGADGAREVLLLRLTSGEFVAARPLPRDTHVWRYQDSLYLGSPEVLTAVDVQSGTEAWSTFLSTSPDDVRFAGDRVVVVGPDRLIGLARENGAIAWSRETDGEVTFRARDAFGCYAQGGKIHAIDLETGADQWERQVSGVVNAPLLAARSVRIHTAGGWLLALDRTRGRLLTRMNIGPPGNLAAGSERFYAWAADDGVHLADLVQQTVSMMIPASDSGLAAEAGQASSPALGVLGPWLWYVEPGGSRVVVRKLGS